MLIDDLDIRVLHRDTGQLIRDAVFQQKRPGQFNGLQLVGGTHSDGYRSSAVFGLAQFVVALATGPSTPENVEAVQVLAQGWIEDMYANRLYDPATRTGIYGVPGEPGETMIDIPTDAGLARGYVLPAPRSQFTTLLSLLFGALFELPTAFNLDQCAEDPSAVAATATCAAAPTAAQTQNLRKTPHQTRRYLLTDGGKRANLLGSMCARVEDASQRPVTFACGG